MAVNNVNYNDTLREGTDKINQSIDQSNEAITKANSADSKADNAVQTANQANTKSDDTQQQLNNIVINNGQSDAEVLQARGTYSVLNERLQATDEQLADIAINPSNYDSLKVAVTEGWDYLPVIQAALNNAESKGGTVHLTKVYEVSSTVKIPSNVTLIAKKGAGLKLLSSAAAKIITNKDTVNGNKNISIIGLTIEGNPSSGVEQNAGIHLVKCADSHVLKNEIKNVKGDGITLGNISGGVVATCENINVSFNVVDSAGRMGIALTDAKNCNVTFNKISNLSNNPLDMGMGIDLEPNFNGQYCQENTVEGNTIKNCKGGIYLASRDNVEFTRGNLLKGNFITGVTSEHGIRSAFSGTRIIDNELRTVAKHGIYLGTGNAVQTSDYIVSGNKIIDASSSSHNVYSCIHLETVVHSNIHDNQFRKSSGVSVAAKFVFSEDVNSGYNSYKGNHARQIGIPYSVQATSKVSHNTFDETQVNNVHEGFTALGDIKLNGNKLNLGAGSTVFNVYNTSGLPSGSVGVDNDIAFVISPALGTPVGYKKVNGSWYPFGQVRYATSIGSVPTFVGQEALVAGVWYKAIGTSSTTDWKAITN